MEIKSWAAASPMRKTINNIPEDNIVQNSVTTTKQQNTKQGAKKKIFILRDVHGWDITKIINNELKVFVRIFLDSRKFCMRM